MSAKELLHILKVQNKRLFIIWIITFIAFIALLGYTIWLLNDIGTATITETSQEVEDTNLTNSNIINGDVYGESKTK